jgi:hypothetical protein
MIKNPFLRFRVIALTTFYVCDQIDTGHAVRRIKDAAN